MKKVFVSLCLTVILGAVGCNKSLTNDAVFTGKWNLIQTLADPGNGSGQWQPVPSNSKQYVEFLNDNVVKSNIYTDYQKYRVIDSARFEFILSNGNTISFRYRLSPGFLEINPPCIEPCGQRFIRK